MYVYPAVFHSEDNRYWVEFPDLPGCQTDGDSVAEALTQASNALGLYLCTLSDHGLTIPVPSDIRTVHKEAGDFTTLVSADPAAHRQRNRAVKKTLTIPEWLNDEAEKRHINFSSVLQQALINLLQ